MKPHPRCSIAADISAQVAMQAFGALKAGIEMVTPPHVPVPFSPTLEDLYIPSAAQVADSRAQHGQGRKALMDDSARAGITPIVMPKWGLSMKEGTVMSWLVEEGAEISVGAAILEVETDKIANAVEAPDPGTLRRKVAQQGETLPVKALLGVMAGAGVSDADIDAYVAAYVTPAESEGEEAEAAPAYSSPRSTAAHPLRAQGAPAVASRCCSSTASAATSTTGCSTSMPSARSHR